MVSGGVFGARGEGETGRLGWAVTCHRGALRFVASLSPERPVAFGMQLRSSTTTTKDYDDIAPTRERKARACRLGQSRVGVASWRCH